MDIGITKFKAITISTLMITAGIAFLLAWFSTSYTFSYVPLFLAGAAGGLLLVLITFKNPYYGFLLNVALCFMVYFPQRILGLPYSLAFIWEIHLVICLMAALFRWKGKNTFKDSNALFTNPITILLLVNFIYILAQFFNPNVPDHVGWLLSLRRNTFLQVVFFAAYYILSDKTKVANYLKFFIIMGAITVAYGYFQELIGFPSWDWAVVNSSSASYALHVQWGLVRKFSFMDVVTFPMTVNLTAMILVIFSLYESNRSRRLLFIIAAGAMLVGGTFAGTRSASFIFPAGLLLFSIANLNNPKNAMAFAGVVALIFILINLPVYRFNQLNRFRSSFTTNEASLEVRNMNRERIQPYLRAHPFGGGLVTTGTRGEELYPSHPLAGFPPDSGLLSTALEKGWVGLMLEMLLFLSMMIEGIKGYFRTNRPEFRKYYMALACGIFSLVVGDYAQIVIFQIPICMFFLPAGAIIIRLKQLEKQTGTPSN